ncbi:MAG: hypothetical protein QOE26_2844 [Verrucomicrobiota bacterium]|jgi:hypothetical protein
MKRLNSTVVVLVLSVGMLFFAGAKQSMGGSSEYYSRGATGVLRMKHSPVLGINVPIAVWIDGVQSGAFAKGHVYERSLAPGRHDVYASRPGQMFDSWYGSLDVRPGETYSFLVKCTVNHVILQPVSRID